MSLQVVDSKGRKYSVSPWDVFFGSGQAIRKKAVRTKSRASEDVKGVEATTQSAPPKEEAKPTGEASKGPEAKTDGGTAKSDAQPDQANGWTKDEDTTLLELKTQKNISWAEVATKLGKSDKEDVKQRFRELKGTGEAKEANAKVDQGKKKDAKALAKTVEAENSRHATDQDRQGHSFGITNTYGLWWRELNNFMDPSICRQLAGLSDDQMSEMGRGDAEAGAIGDFKALTMEETMLLARLEAYAEEQKWLWIVSKMYERTGNLFQPTALKSKWEGQL